MQIMSAEFPSSRLAEGLLLHADRGEGILLRIYRTLKEMVRERNVTLLKDIG